MDEPTTGLHLSDIQKLLKLFDMIVSCGNTLVVIEHNLDVIKQADWIIDIGPMEGTMEVRWYLPERRWRWWKCKNTDSGKPPFVMFHVK